jgi:glycosyltransferase involved in cell wall biosynthesis
MDHRGDAGAASVTAAAGEPNFSVVIPAFNEGANVEPVVHEVVAAIAERPWVGSYEIVLVNDGSRDDTAAVMDRLAGELPQVRVFHHPANRGFGAALKTGFSNSRGAAVTFISADGEMGIEHPLRLLREMGDRDLMLSGRSRTVTAGREFLTLGVNWISRILLGFWPEQSYGMWVIKGDVLRAIPLHSETGLVNLEIILYCRAHGKAMALSGVSQARPRLSGESKVTNLPTILNIFREMWRLRWRIKRGR